MANGASYLSLTGFYDQTPVPDRVLRAEERQAEPAPGSRTSEKKYSGAGMAQLNLLGRLLELRGFEQWDLGMMMEYKKKDLLAVNVPRAAFVSNLGLRRNDCWGRTVQQNVSIAQDSTMQCLLKQRTLVYRAHARVRFYARTF